ncbi:Uncharacterised protein [Kluyvera cryocrescens]|uniref:Uncharacterized protein n=1 Tax=Kluyvera cryocrescens TaxID=580 RepID=A0A485B6G7_KLUCR|nr:Uncharacterised protein [Kluyvera cryocrescens]
MLEMLMQWYRRRFSDPEAIALLVILVAGFCILFFFSGLLAPLLVALRFGVSAGVAYRSTGAFGLVTQLGDQRGAGAVRRYSAAHVICR